MSATHLKHPRHIFYRFPNHSDPRIGVQTDPDHHRAQQSRHNQFPIAQIVQARAATLGLRARKIR
jgi:hypothetical protein